MPKKLLSHRRLYCHIRNQEVNNPRVLARVTQIFPRKTLQPFSVELICLYIRKILLNGLKGKPFSNPSQPFRQKIFTKSWIVFPKPLMAFTKCLKVFVSKFVTCITNFVICITNFLIHVTNFVTKTFLYDPKNYLADSENYLAENKNYLAESGP